MVGKAAIGLLLVLAQVGFASESIEGVWIAADDDGLIEIRINDGLLSGVIAGSLSDPERKNPARHDDLNPDPDLRERPLLGLAIFSGLQASGSNKWKGEVYDPNSGKTYKCTVTLVDTDTVKIRGYIGFSLLGRTEEWTRR